MLERVRIGMVGAGAVAARHVRTLLAMDGVEVAGVADPALERARELASSAGAAAYPNHMELLAAIEAGLPFFVEKPVAIDQETAAGIAAALAGRPLVTCTGYHWRWLDIFDRAAALLAERPARLVQCAWLDKVPPPPWWLRRDGSGGQVIEQTTHVLDTARALAGEVAEVHAFGAREPAAEIHDVSVASLRFASGAVGTVVSSCLLPHLHRAGVQVVADGLSLELSETELVVEADRRRDAWTADADARPRPDRDFVAAVRGGENRVRVPWPEAYRTHLLACAITRSAEEGRALPVGRENGDG